MKLLRSIVTMAAVFLLAFSISLYSVRAARGSDHQDSPTVVKNPLADITDVYLFPDPHDASRVALAMDVRPLIPKGMTAGIALDPKGFVHTGANGGGLLETNVHGVFAIGDVRSGSVKRVAASVGEGAQVIAAVHGFLAELPAEPKAAAVG